MKIPDKIYVTFKKQPVNVYNEQLGIYEVESYGPLLGFMHPFNLKKPNDKKHETQRDWAYRNYNNLKLEERFGVWWMVGTKVEWVYKPQPHSVVTPIEEPVDPQPALFDNTPLSGFKIQHFVSRYSTSNKVWRILDPRGFELEVSTACLDEIIRNADIAKGGEIMAKCVWYTNKQLKVT